MESTLSLRMSDLEGAIGDYLGYGRGAANGDQAWTTSTQRDITFLRNSGERQFYYPMIEGQMYKWSFLRPILTLTIPQGQKVPLPMPDDFGGIEGEIVASNLKSLLWETVPLIADVRSYYARNPTLTGRPRLAVVESIKGTTTNTGQRQQLYVWPIPDQDYQLQMQSYVHPGAMNGTLPYALGGPQHAETLQAAVIAAAELYRDDVAGIRSDYFQQRLQASVNEDRKLKPQLLGYNRDRSDMREVHGWGPRARDWGNFAGITFNGVSYP